MARKLLGLDCLPLGWYPENTNAYGHGVDEWGRVFNKGQYSGGLVKDFTDLQSHSPPLSHAKDWFPEDRVEAINREYTNSALYFAWHDCAFGLSYLRVGMEEFFCALLDNPEFVKAIIQDSSEWTLALVREANANKVDFIILGDDAAYKT
jgi:hypothetical protein